MGCFAQHLIPRCPYVTSLPQVILAAGSSLVASGEALRGEVKEAAEVSVASWQLGLKTTELGMGAVFQQWVEAATEEGYWVESLEISPVPTQEMPKPRRDFFIRRGNLVFNAGHSILQENIAAVTEGYVNRVIE